MATLLTLPIELILTIVLPLPPKTLARLALLSRASHATFNPLLWHTLTLSWPSASRLTSLAYSPHVGLIVAVDVRMHISQRNDHMIQNLRALLSFLLALSPNHPASPIRTLRILFDIDSTSTPDSPRLLSFPTEEARLLTSLSRCRFPLLRTFHLTAEGEPLWSPDPSPLRAFLLSHPGIEDLKLSLRTREDGNPLIDSFLFPSPSSFPPSGLPALRAYSGSYPACSTLCSPSSNRPIRVLELGPRAVWGTRAQYPVEGVLGTLEGTRGGLERLHVTYRSVEHGERANGRVLRGVADSCPRLVSFRGTFSSTTISMYTPLSPLPHLTHLTIEFYPVDSDRIGDRVQVKDALRALVAGSGFAGLREVELKSVFDEFVLRYRVVQGEGGRGVVAV